MCRHDPANTANSWGLPLHEQVWSNPMEGLLWLSVCVCVGGGGNPCIPHVSLVLSDGKSVPQRILMFLLAPSTVEGAITSLTFCNQKNSCNCNCPCKSF